MFCHLHLHSQYSILESNITIGDVVSGACRYGMQAAALTDRNVMHGAIEFYCQARAKGLKPILGCQVYLHHSGLWSLVLLCRNEAGYRNLCRLITRAHTESRGTVPYLEAGWIKQNCSGLTALSPARQGQIPVLLGQGHKDEAGKALQFYQELFGDDFYLEIQRYPASVRAAGISETLVNFARQQKANMVATNDVHYLKQQHWPDYQAVYKLKSMAGKIDPCLRPVDNDQHYFKSPRQMEELFADLPEAISNTRLIANSCQLELKLGHLDIPRFKVPRSGSQSSYLKALCYAGLKKRYGRPGPQLYHRLDYELEVISDRGYSSYFLMVWDIARFARQQHIPTCGKGSAAGSLASYVLGISDVDPVKNNLYFERFLNRQRKQPPDIDMDIAHQDREKVLEYLQQRYGSSNVGRVCTFATLRTRAAVRETSRILNYSKQETDQLLLDLKYQKKDARSRYNNMVLLSSRISERIRHLSTHPSAVIVSEQPLEEKIPMMLSSEGKLMSQYDMNSIEELGILKIDLINSLSLTLIQEVTRMLKQEGLPINTETLAENDARVFSMISKGNTLGVFQLESTGIRSLARSIKPACLQDIALLLALYRPGPQQSGLGKDFIKRKFGRQKVTYPHPDLEPILAETYGIIIYQEQALRIARLIAGYSFSQADLLRRAITKRSRQQMQTLKQTFIKGARNQGYDSPTASLVFGYISKFASYGFLKAHALAYARLSYLTCYLKNYFPAYFLAAILSYGSGYYPAAQYVEEARRFGISIKPPSINSSGFKFMPKDKGRAIQVPLTSVKGLGPATVKHIIEERNSRGAFKGLDDFCRRCMVRGKISSTAVQSLIRVGAFDFAASNRRKLLLYFWQKQKNKEGGHGLGSVSDFSLADKLCLETELLGFAASASPLSCYRDEISRLKVTSSRKFKHNSQVMAAGMVINRRIEKTKSGEEMLFCTLEDEGGMYECLFFSQAYLQNRITITRYPALLVKGRASLKEGSILIIAGRVWSLDNLKRARQKLKDNNIKNQLLAEAVPVWPQRQR